MHKVLSAPPTRAPICAVGAPLQQCPTALSGVAYGKRQMDRRRPGCLNSNRPQYSGWRLPPGGGVFEFRRSSLEAGRATERIRAVHLRRIRRESMDWRAEQRPRRRPPVDAGAEQRRDQLEPLQNERPRDGDPAANRVRRKQLGRRRVRRLTELVSVRIPDRADQHELQRIAVDHWSQCTNSGIDCRRRVRRGQMDRGERQRRGGCEHRRQDLVATGTSGDRRAVAHTAATSPVAAQDRRPSQRRRRPRQRPREACGRSTGRTTRTKTWAGAAPARP